MKTSNKILLGLMIVLLLLWLALIAVFRVNAVPIESTKNTNSFMMGDLRGLDSDGPFDIRVLQYIGDSKVKMTSMSDAATMLGTYGTKREYDTGILELTVLDSTVTPNRADVHVKMKECNSFRLAGSTDMHFANPVEEDIVRFELKDATHMNIEVKADSIYLDMTNNTKATIAGTTKVLHVMASDNAFLNTTGLVAEKVIVDIKQSAEANVYASEKISGKISATEQLKYKGNPKEIEVDGL